MTWIQREIILEAKPRGYHVITGDLLKHVPEIKKIKVGLAHIFIKHTSASITINENVSSDVRNDFESHFNKLAPENASYYTHRTEGPDDMPAHIKTSIFGSSLTIPITDGDFNLGTWQGVYLCEHRSYGGRRKLIITLTGTTE